MAEQNLRVVQHGELARADDGPDHVVLAGDVSSLRGTVALLLGFGAWVEVLDPPELRALMAEVAREALAVHG